MPTDNRTNELESNASKVNTTEGDMEAPIMSSSQETSIGAASTSGSQPDEHCDISHLLFAIDIQIHNVLHSSTTDLPYSLSYCDLVEISQTLEEVKDLREHLMYCKDFHQDPNTARKESLECQGDSTDAPSRHDEELTNNTMDTLFNITTDQDADIERLTRNSQLLRETVEKLTETNESLVKQNIALRRQARDLKNASISIMPLTPSPHQIPEDFVSEAPQRFETMADSPPRETCFIPAQQAASSLLPQRLSRTPKTSIKTKLMDTLGKLLSRWKVRKLTSIKSLLSQRAKNKESRERRPTSRNPSKLTKKRTSFDKKAISESSTTSSSVGQKDSWTEKTSQKADVDDELDASSFLYLATRDRECRLILFVLISLREELEVHPKISFRKLRRAVLSDFETYCSVCLTDPALLEYFDTAFEEALEFLELRRTADGTVAR